MHLALAEIRRASLRFGLLAGSIGLLVFLLLFLNTLSATLLGFFVGAIENNSADVLVYDSSARRNLVVSRLDEESLASVAAVPGVERAAPLMQTALSADAGGGPTDISLWGFEPGAPGRPAKVIDGREPAQGEALVDEADVASGFRMGGEIKLLPSGHRLKIVGVTANSRFAVLPTVYVSADEYRIAFLSTYPEAPDAPVNAVAVASETGVDPRELAERITSEIPAVEALDRDTAAASIPGVESISQSFSVILLITFAIVVLVVGFFFLILTVQKLKVLTALRAVGAPLRYLGISLAYQIALTTGIGITAGSALLGLATATSSSAFPLRASPSLIATTSVVILATALATGVFSLRRVARLDPAEAARVR